MKIKINLFISLLLLAGLFSSCENDGEKAIMSANPKAPELKTLPNLTFTRDKGSDTLTFVGTEVELGFKASATYYLEAAAAGTNFANPINILTGINDNMMKISVSDLNSKLLAGIPADQKSSVDFRIRAILAVDAGTGAPGSGTDPFEYTSETVTADVTTYGLPRLDLQNSGMDQSIKSPLGNGVYSGFVKIDPAMPFKLYDPDNNVTYGASGSNLVANGVSGIMASGAAGWYNLTASTTDLKYSMDAYMIGLVGSATPNGWNTPDQKMDYNTSTGKWSITVDLIVGEIKFRLNDGWAWNLGYNTSNHSLSDLVHNGDNIAIDTAGNYTITLTITNATSGSEAGKCTIVKNN